MPDNNNDTHYKTFNEHLKLMCVKISLKIDITDN